MQVICDIEGDSLGIPENIWCIVCKDIETDEVYTFGPSELADGTFTRFAKGVTLWIGHNFGGYDKPALVHHYNINPDPYIDTLILSRISKPKRMGGHSLDNWGVILNYPKLPYKDFSRYTPEMMAYCINDVELTHRVYLRLKNTTKNFSSFSIKLEHKMQEILDKMRDDGFYFHKNEAEELHYRLTTRFNTLEEYITSEFPPKIVEEVFIPKVNNKQRGYKKGEPFIKRQVIPFNIKSPKQVVERMNEAGWKPHLKTKSHQKAARRKDFKGELKKEWETKGWRVCEENLATLPDTAPTSAKSIAEYLMLASRIGKLDEWFKALGSDSRVHGTCLSLGASTHRASHYDPNMANIPVAPHPYGMECRSLWGVHSDERSLVGVDASGIQLRLLAHLVGDEGYIKTVCEGKEEDETDIHNVNKKALGICKSRNDAKTFIYAFLLGAGVSKIAEILGCTFLEARDAISRFLSSIPGLRELKEVVIPRWASKGYMVALDGRLIEIEKEHTALSVYLQGNEKIIMALATILGLKEIKNRGLDAKLVAFVHDEWVFDTLKAHDEEVKEIMIAAIEKAGTILKCKCPLTGGGSIGRTWHDVH